MAPTLAQAVIQAIVDLAHSDPFAVLGQHPVEIDGISSWVVRAFQPDSRSVVFVDDASGRETPMFRCHDLGFFELPFSGRTQPFSYKLKVTDYQGDVRVFKDHFTFLPSLDDTEIGLFLQGKNDRIFDHLGAHPMTHEGVDGVRFTLWAPSAQAVSVIGTFNDWDRRYHPMRPLGGSGVWEIFIPHLSSGVLYKFQLVTMQGVLVDKTDPYAFRTEIAPQTASLVHSLGGYQWGDQSWMKARKTTDHVHAPMSIYEVHVGSWLREPWDAKEEPNFREIAPRLVAYVKEMGFTHIELLPVTEHPFGGSWGYQTTGYYAPSSRWGTPEDLMFLVDLCHKAGVGVILDWVPGHFPKDSSALGRFDGTALYEHLDPRLGEHPDWGTFIFNYRRSEVRNFLIGSALFWLEYYHIDGIRIDAVSSMLYLDFGREPGEWVPNRLGGRENLEAIDFLRELNTVVQDKFPGVFTAAEESTSWPGVTAKIEDGGLGFTFKWNLGWMHDILEFLSMDPILRKFHQKKLTFALWYAFDEKFILPLSHDEVVHLKRSLLGKMPGDMWQQFANLRLLLAYQIAHPGKKLLFMGGDLGQWTEWNHNVGMQWQLLGHGYHDGANRFLRDLNHIYKNTQALHTQDYESEGFEWIDFSDEERSIVAFLRKGPKLGQQVLVVFNFTPVVRRGYALGVDRGGVYREILNSDASMYGGSNVGNDGQVEALPKPRGERSHTLYLTLPPLGCLILEPDPLPEAVPEPIVIETALSSLPAAKAPRKRRVQAKAKKTAKATRIRKTPLKKAPAKKARAGSVAKKEAAKKGAAKK